MGNIFYEDFRDFIKALSQNDVEYMLVGGYSVILHGHPRTTGDMDIWVNRTQSNYKKLRKAFETFGMDVFDMTEENFLHHTNWDVFSFGRPPVSIDIMIKVKGLKFDDAFKNSNMFSEDGLKVRVIDYKDLVKAKKASNRPKDIDDLNNLSKLKDE